MNIDLLLAYYCAPTLKGLKPANLILHETYKKPQASYELEQVKLALRNKQIEMLHLWDCPEKTLTLVYHREHLWQHICQADIKAFLKKEGYPVDENLNEVLDVLNSRISKGSAFPHEVGIFLGYPLVDVLGFIEHQGQNCKFCGYWKVYDNEEATRSLFDSFTIVRDHMVTQLQKGSRLMEILQSA